ncbi:glutamate--cysteine ligase [Alteromonas sp. 5E99-2]|uniref:glutamate--cysteine ligase n=1 Tax=Alteromonas sp. 5E99-2 TaxID=2817683 RepID=UPI001A999C1D|nr:glutamate--cysteine ligase [Alteromonas sp. 5E99-2]MBO1255993.1 glutamate--cysteine ligase [Alteromonas sp. 5E99-2]
MIKPNETFLNRLAAVESEPNALMGIQHGVERETLKINETGAMSVSPHPEILGSALTHESITTDFSESLLEFITPPEKSITKSMNQLADIHKFVSESCEERLWPLSMPCFIKDEHDIPLAYYGESNSGKMKRVYRVGLKNRYGSMMQVISGVHFNFSFPAEFWEKRAEMEGQEFSTDFQSEQYFSLLRNYRRYSWLIPYLYGSSPAICDSFIKDKEVNLPFEKVGDGSLYLPYATSLRLSDLGYTNVDQSKMHICYNSLDSYVDLLRNAMNTPSELYSKFNAGENGHWQQLSKNILQIENELYSSVRPKQPTLPLEKPTDALVNRGVSYIEVRALDVNPYSPYGISEEQFYFLDVFLLTCALKPSQKLDAGGVQEAQANFKSIVLEGRRPSLILQRDGQSVSMQAWASQLFDEFRHAANALDKANGTNKYTQAVEREWEKILDPNLTFSGRWLNELLEKNKDNAVLGLEKAEQYHKEMMQHNYVHTDDAAFRQQAVTSLEQQKQKDNVEDVPFEEFIARYFSQAPAKKMPSDKR